MLLILARSKPMDWNRMVPELSVTSLERSLPFYTNLLGFTLAFRRDDPPFAYLDDHLAADALATGEVRERLSHGDAGR